MTLNLFAVLCVGLSLCVHGLEDATHWKTVGRTELEAALRVKPIDGVAKNVVLFVGDGMGPSTITAARIYQDGEQSNLVFESFPYVGLLKTYAVDKKVPDSACTATALFTGVKTNYEVSGVDARVNLTDCETSRDPNTHVSSILQWAQKAGKATGFVTTTRVTHATPSALYAHVADRRWECDGKMPPEAQACKDIARQLVEEKPGININVIMGGGRQCLQSNIKNSSGDPIDTWACRRKDGRDLIATWSREKAERNVRYAVVNDTGSLHDLDLDKTDYLLGVFANGHLKMDYERDNSSAGMPSLEQMTVAAIKVLQKNPKGYILVVEGGMIDFAHHRGHARQALDETLAMERAVRTALHHSDRSDTLLAVTSDHDQGMSFVGYAPRQSSILGIAQKSKVDKTSYTSLLYATGDGSNYQYSSIDSHVQRKNPEDDDTSSFMYSQQSGVLTDEVTHAGTDVAVYALGPMAHLFSGVHEQNYVAYVIAYAAKIGEFETSTAPAIDDYATGVFISFFLTTMNVYQFNYM